MEVGLYGHRISELISLLSASLDDKGIEVVTASDCLCEYSSLERGDLEDIIVVHPADDDNENCWARIRDIVARYNDINFYVFTFGNLGRQEGIGAHPNVKYITRENSGELFMEIVEKVSVKKK